VMKAGQSSIALEGANITLACPGVVSVKGSGLGLEAGGSGAVYISPLPGQTVSAADADADAPRVEQFDEQFHLVAEDGVTPLANRQYRITASHGQVWEGVSGPDGLTERVYTDAAVSLSIEVFPSDSAHEVIV
jgi:type VI secretion system secreted protein VgrG